MTTPLVTVLIDTYNYGRYIEEAIGSVLAQDFPTEQREILVVDDGSTDDTEERLRKLGGSITYLRKPNGGQASAFNFGLERSRGEIVALLDADDYWLPGKLWRVVEEFEKHPDAGMVYHKVREFQSQRGLFKDGGLPLLSGFLPSNAKDLLSYVLYPTSFLAFRRSALEPLLPIPEKLTIQADAYLSGLIVFLAPIVGVPECLAVYRVHGQNLFADSSGASSARQELRLKTRRLLVNGMKAWLDERGYNLHQSDLHAFFKQWDLSQEKDEFAAAPPGRVKISRHLMQYAHFYAPQLTWRHRAVTYANAAGSLVVGYKNVHLLDEWRVAVKRAFRGAAGPVVAGGRSEVSGEQSRPSR
jgi:glycosyltransferase involved in cell wall biosynthesis